MVTNVTATGDFAFVSADVPLEAIFCLNKHRHPTIRQAAEQGVEPDRLQPALWSQAPVAPASGGG